MNGHFGIYKYINVHSCVPTSVVFFLTGNIIIMNHMLMYHRVSWKLCQLWPDFGRGNTSSKGTNDQLVSVILFCFMLRNSFITLKSSNQSAYNMLLEWNILTTNKVYNPESWHVAHPDFSWLGKLTRPKIHPCGLIVHSTNHDDANISLDMARIHKAFESQN